MWAGFYRGWRETIAMRVADVIMSFPSLLLAVSCCTYSAERRNIVAVLAIIASRYLRTARAESAELSSRVFVDAARTFGGSGGSIIAGTSCDRAAHAADGGHARLLLRDACRVVTELPGHRHPATRRQLGLMVSQGRTYLHTAWWLSFFPGLAIVITTVWHHSGGLGTIAPIRAAVAAHRPAESLSRFTRLERPCHDRRRRTRASERTDADPALRVEGLTVDIRPSPARARRRQRVLAAHRGETLACWGVGCGNP